MSENNYKQEVKCFLAGMTFGLFVAMVLIVVPFIRPARGVSDLKQQAVEHGYAEWRVTHAHDGKTEFIWLDKPKTTHP